MKSLVCSKMISLQGLRSIFFCKNFAIKIYMFRMHNELNNYSFWKPISHECFLQKNMFNPWITYFKLKPVQIPTKAFVQQVRHIILAQWRHNDSHHDDLQRCRARVSNCECRSKETFTAPGYTFLTTVYKRTYVCMYVCH